MPPGRVASYGDIGALAGQTLDAATQTLSEFYITASGDPARFFTDAAEGTVIRALVTPPGGGDAVDCTNGCTALEGSTVTFDVSAGPVPDVVGDTQDAAIAALEAVGLKASVTEDFSDDVEEVPLSNIRKVTAKRLTESKQNAPH